MKRIHIFLICLLVVVVGISFVFQNYERYEISPNPTSQGENPIQGVSLEIEANSRGGTVKIVNESDHYIVIEPSRRPIHIDIYLENGWHNIVSNKRWRAAAGAIPEHSEYELEFKWRDILGSNLKEGKYRATLFYGDGSVKAYDFFSSIIEFSIQ